MKHKKTYFTWKDVRMIIAAIAMALTGSHLDSHLNTGWMGITWIGKSMSDQHNEIYSTIDRVTVLETTVSNLQWQIKQPKQRK